MGEFLDEYPKAIHTACQSVIAVYHVSFHVGR